MLNNNDALIAAYQRNTPRWKRLVAMVSVTPLIFLGFSLTAISRFILALHPIDGILALCRWAKFPGQVFFYRPYVAGMSVYDNKNVLDIPPPIRPVWRCSSCQIYTPVMAFDVEVLKCISCGSDMRPDVVNEKGETIL